MSYNARIRYRFDDSNAYKILQLDTKERFITAKQLRQKIWHKESLGGFDFGIQLIDSKTKQELDGEEPVHTYSCVIVKKIYDSEDNAQK